MSNDEPKPGGRIRAVRKLIDRGVERYDPDRHLDRLLGGSLWSPAAGDRAQTIARLERALRSQRQLGRAGHWSYDLNRHFGLLQALKAERDRARAQTTATAGAKAVVPAAAGISDTGTETS